ncbi:uncharacterized protein LOC114319765 [Camellia sinensis]|uniref:uncharacterized protein LOC114319765 n=1 Tax=Camellia sinensis TaxID=4442 RepID=UPI0010356554|nr:uncharacterized protein LOC114319765 [Camellia sinensis]
MAISGKTTTITNPSSTLHPPYLQMISATISSLKDRTGSSQPASDRKIHGRKVQLSASPKFQENVVDSVEEVCEIGETCQNQKLVRGVCIREHEIGCCCCCFYQRIRENIQSCCEEQREDEGAEPSQNSRGSEEKEESFDPCTKEGISSQTRSCYFPE